MDEVATIDVGLTFYSKPDGSRISFWRTANARAGLVAWEDTKLTYMYTPGNRYGAYIADSRIVHWQVTVSFNLTLLVLFLTCIRVLRCKHNDSDG
jgi:hypothetical protein